jgi:uridine kinase
MKIVIDLAKQGDAQSYDVGSLIQREAREKFRNLAESFIASIDNKKPRSSFGQLDRVHNTILINGKRGMGKTTFMLSILEELCGNQKPKDECEQYKKCKDKDKNNISEETNRPVDMDSLRRDICVLEILDPTLIETKEHVLLNIITKIKTQVEKHRECRQECKERDGDYHEWIKSLKKLAGGVNLLDGVGGDAPLKDKMYEDSALVLEQGLCDAKQGSKLEEYLHEFIKKSLEMLDKKAFLLVFDDIDTSLKEGRDILETLRKYLTSRQLITVMLGDIDLYSTLVRQLQWEKIDPNKTLEKYEKEELKDGYKKQIDVLEQQYLIKLLKPENRIDLKTVDRINKEKKKHEITIIFSDKTERSLDDTMREIGKEFLMTSSGYFHPFFASAALSFPIRSILQIIKAFDKAKIKNDMQIYIDATRHTFDLETREFEKYGLGAQADYDMALNNYVMYSTFAHKSSSILHKNNLAKNIYESPINRHFKV